MQVVYRHGSLIHSPSPYRSHSAARSPGDPAAPRDPRGTEPVVVIDISAEARRAAAQPTRDRSAEPSGEHPGAITIRIGGSELRVQTSEAAALRDQEVRTHERAHLAALGAHAAGPIVYQSHVGTDGRSYATGGSIAVDLAPVPNDPGATLKKARAIISAAYAPGSPSAADRRVAAQAYRLAASAKREIQSNQESRYM